MKVLIADDYVLVREGIKNIFQWEKDINIVGEAQDGELAIKLAKALKPDIMLLKLRLSKINAFAVTSQVKDKSKVIILADEQDKMYVAELLDLGAAGWLNYGMPACLMKKAVRDVFAGEKYFPIDILVQKPEQLFKSAIKNKKALTLREIEILQLIGIGMNNNEIAEALFLSEKTVKNHLTNIFKKIGVNDRTQALLYALKNRMALLS